MALETPLSDCDESVLDRRADDAMRNAIRKVFRALSNDLEGWPPSSPSPSANRYFYSNYGVNGRLHLQVRYRSRWKLVVNFDFAILRPSCLFEREWAALAIDGTCFSRVVLPLLCKDHLFCDTFHLVASTWNKLSWDVSVTGMGFLVSQKCCQ